MEVDAVAADADGVGEMLGRELFTRPVGDLRASICADVLLDRGEFRDDAAGFAFRK